MYQLNGKCYASVFVTPGIIVDKYIKMASFCAVKSLLWILKNQGGNFSAEDIAKAIGSSVNDTKEAIEYWINEGILTDSESNDEVSLQPLQSDTQYLDEKKEQSQAPQQEKKTVLEIKIARPTTEQIVKRMNEDKRIKSLFNLVQELLGRTIGFDLQSALLMMYDTYGLDFDIILTLIQFCVDSGKASNAYILSIAKLWYEKDITTLELAHEFISEHTRVNEIFNEFKQFTDVTASKPTPSMTNYFLEWDKMGFSVEMIVLAYNEAVEREIKKKYPYMNGILTKWNENGYKTPADVENAKQEFKSRQTENTERSYDIEKAVTKATYEPIKYKKKEKRSQ